MKSFDELKKFYSGKRVLLTGHTGFKGTYLTLFLEKLGAEVYGYSLEPPTDPSLYAMFNGKGLTKEFTGDIRDFDALKAFFDSADPDIIVHMAAQPIVRESYRIPRETFDINVMGTVNLLECLRLSKSEKTVSFLNVTTDKVYFNEEKPGYGYKENDRLFGFDPYSNSKSCSELVTGSYKNAFFPEGGRVRISTARAGNVIGGGDFAKDRIIPDCIRAYLSGESLYIRNPRSTRPYQHVLEPLTAYLLILCGQYDDPEKAGSYNVGPDSEGMVTTGELCDMFSKCLRGFTAEYKQEPGAVHEAGFLMLDNSLIKNTFGWESVWDIGEAVKNCARFAAAYSQNRENACTEVLNQIDEYIDAWDRKHR